MEFLDEDQPYAPRKAPVPRRRGPERQQIVARRAIAVAVGILVLILLIIGIKGCLNARKQRGLENYASDVRSLVRSSDQLSTGLFKQLDNPGSSGQSLTDAVQVDSGTADSLLKQAQGISAPGEVSGAKGSLVQAFQLRSDGIAGLATALQSGGSARATQRAAQLAVDHMKELVASDAIYIRSKDSAEAALADADVSSQIPPSVFVPDPSHWLSPATFEPLIGTSSGTTTTTAGGSPCVPKGSICGLELTSTAISGTTLQPNVPVTVTGDSIDVTVTNGGDITEKSVQVSYSLKGGGSGQATIPSIASQASQTATLKLKPAPPAGKELDLTVTVGTVPGEHISANNKSSYTVTFSG